MGGDHQGDGRRADAADVGQEEEGEEEAGQEEGEEAEEEEGQEEEEEEEEEGQEEEEKEEKAEEEGCRALRRQDAVRRPRRDLRQEQDGPLGGREGHLGLHYKNKLNKGRTITPDAKLKKVVPANSVSMFKMT